MAHLGGFLRINGEKQGIKSTFDFTAGYCNYNSVLVWVSPKKRGMLQEIKWMTVPSKWREFGKGEMCSKD